MTTATGSSSAKRAIRLVDGFRVERKSSGVLFVDATDYTVGNQFVHFYKGRRRDKNEVDMVACEDIRRINRHRFQVNGHE